MNSSLPITPHPSPSIVAPPTSAPLLQPLNPSWLDDSDVPTFIPSTFSPSSGSKRRQDSDASLPSKNNTFFLATPLEMTSHAATRSGVNVVSPPSTPRFRLRMRPSSEDDIFNHLTMTTPSTPAPIATNSAPQANQFVTPKRIDFNMMTELSDGPNPPDLVNKKLTSNVAEGHKTASAAEPKVVVTSKKRKTMRRNNSFNALCA